MQIIPTYVILINSGISTPQWVLYEIAHTEAQANRRLVTLRLEDKYNTYIKVRVKGILQ